MSDLPGYDAWKLMSPEDERPDCGDMDEECPFCGAGKGGDCLLDDNDKDELPPCIDLGGKPERDPDQWREEREEARMDRETDR
jgi:hypothetical protein